MPRGNPSCMSFLVADDYAVCEGIQSVIFTKDRKQIHRPVIGTLCHVPCPFFIRTLKARAPCIPDAVRLTHFHADMGVITFPSAMPAPVVPGKGLIDLSRTCVYKCVDTGSSRCSIIPVLYKNLRRRLGASHAVKHKPGYPDLFSRFIAGILF